MIVYGKEVANFLREDFYFISFEEERLTIFKQILTKIELAKNDLESGQPSVIKAKP